MPRVTISEAVQAVLRSALATFKGELDNLLQPIITESRRAQYDPAEHVPEAYREDQETVVHTIKMLSAGGELATGLAHFGVNLSNEYLAAMRSALILWREDLQNRLLVIQADPLSPPEAAGPLLKRIGWLDSEVERFWAKWGVLPTLAVVKQRRILKAGLAYPHDLPLDAALSNGEGQEIEFIQEYPKQAHDLAKEIAAFATSNPGTIYLGVDDDGKVIGIPDIDTIAGKDALRLRIEGVCSNSVLPAIIAKVEFERYSALDTELDIAVIKVPRGPAPVYYSNNIPYVRHVSRSRPAQHQEVTELVRRYLDREKR